MDSQINKAKNFTEEEFRSCYPDVSIQHLPDKASLRVAPSVGKVGVLKNQNKAPAMPKTQSAKLPATKPQNVKTQNVGVKTNVPTKVAIPVLAKTPVVPKSPVMTKTPALTKTPVAKCQVVNKTPVPIGPMTKSPQAVVKGGALLKTPSLLKVAQTKSPVKVPQNVIKQLSPNAPKTTVKPTATATMTPTPKEDNPDQSTTTVLTYHMPQSTPQRISNQLSIEKIEQQQRIPVVLDTNNQVVLQQVINNGHVVVQNRVTPAETTLQSVVIGTSPQAATPVVTPLPQVKITTSESADALLQVTQQVTLYKPKGSTITVDDVKKQIGLNKQNTTTNVVSNTINSIPAPVSVPTQAVQPEQNRKMPAPARVQGVLQSPNRQSNRVNPQLRPPQKAPNVRSYQSTRGQVKKLSPKREIPMQKVSPMQPPPLPPPELQFGNEEEVITSEEMPQEVKADTQLILILPSGEKKRISIKGQIPLNYTIQDLLKRLDAPIPESMHAENMTAEICTADEEENFQYMESNEVHWDNTEHSVPEPGEILGLQDDVEPELDSDAIEQRMDTEIEEALKNTEPKNRKTKADSLPGESPKKKKVCRKKRLEEPVCLTISDDDDSLAQVHHSQMAEESFHSDSNSQMSSCDKEPVITDEMVSELKQSVSGGGIDMEELLDNPDPDEKTYLQCRTVRIGSYKVVPKDKVLITPHGLKVTVPVLNSDQYVELKILYHEIIKVLIHFGRQMPVLFFYTRPSAAAKIRKALKMEDKTGFYYDSTSSDETHRRITFLPDKIDEDCKQTLKTIFGDPENNVFAELTGKEANDILVKASPKEVQAFILKKQPNHNQQQQQQPFNGQNIQTIMVYPPPPEKGGIPINTEDYACLGEDQFLNDVIIDFYLKYVVEKTLSPEDRARTHVFSSFFYKRLTTKPPPKRKSMNPVENDPTASPAVKRHSRVKSWTKNVNLFTKDFIVIPINENSHWFLAIICFPGLTGPVRFSDNTPIELPSRKKKKNDDKAAVGVLSGKHMVTIGSTTITAVTSPPTTLDDEGEDRDEADGEDEDMDVPDSDEDAIQRSVPPEVKEEPDEDHGMTTRKKQREPIKQPCILIFDSLAGASRLRVVATLRDYLRVEYEAKHGEARNFSGDVMKGTNLRCPQQTNYTDCGLYVLQYVEAFFQWPITDYHIPIKQLQDWFQADIVSRKRYEIQQLLHRLMQEQGIDIEALNLPLLNLRPEGKHLVEYSGTEEEDDDDEEEEEDDQICEDEEDDILDEDAEYNEEMGHDEEMEEGEIPNHNDDDPDNFVDPTLDHEEPEMDEDDYVMEDEDIPEEEEDEIEKELEDISFSTVGSMKNKEELKKYRIPRLTRRETVTDEQETQ